MAVSPEALGRAIKTLRTALGIERRALAERAGLSYPYLSQIENGQRDPSTAKLTALAEQLGVQLHELYEVAEGAPPADPARSSGSALRDVATEEIARTVMEKVSRLARRPAAEGSAEPDAVVHRLERLVELGKDLKPSDLDMLLGLAERLHGQRDDA